MTYEQQQRQLRRIEWKIDWLIHTVVQKVIDEPALLERLAQELAHSTEDLQESIDAASPDTGNPPTPK